MRDWRYLLFELDGAGNDRLVTGNLKLSRPRLTRCLSGPHQITGTIDIPDATLAENHEFAFKRWKTAVFAENPNEEIWTGGLVADFVIDGPVVSLDVAGYTAALKGQPYDGIYNGVQVDPLEPTRELWAHHQTKAGGNLGLDVDDTTTTPTRIGTPANDVNFTTGSGEQVAFTEGPYKLNWWSTHDSGGKVDELAKLAPFDYLEDHFWDGETLRHKLRFGYPQIGVVRDNLRFVLGENVYKMPQEHYDDEDTVTEVWVFGAGEGQNRVRGVASVGPVHSLRRVKVVTEKAVTSQAHADRVAGEILATYQDPVPGAGITELLIRNHPHAPLGSYDVGDTIPYAGDHDWGPVEVWVRIVKLTISPEDGDDVIATVIRA